ncbi:MAG: alpha/beta hydrolase, partial [Pseudomonadales bacterium]
FDYDPAIRQQTQGGNIPPFWPFYEQLHRIPTLVIRGESSDLLSELTYQQMLATHPNAQGVMVGQTGHAPTLKEPEAQAALTAFLN